MPKQESTPGNRQDSKDLQAHREALEILHEICALLDVPLDHRTLAICTTLIENGVNPEALAVCIGLQCFIEKHSS
ncbi:hypothetical protein ONS95_006505 [Cadophora gregata]|uniref:uncharacterized protein n=1 Tax=Cadophora gregata TaxID=51156 RepID=UPI0026DDBCAB|nr:uncharacterized protein ONS95_006505 [Cadophora gregata]KAK0101329.1 hypothetical protein ONS95_006505 [Cadophora gregata]